MEIKIRLTFAALLTLFQMHLAAQGCSDAGVCTLNAFKPTGQTETTESKHYLRLGLTTGQADHDISVFGSLLEYGYQASHLLNFDVKLTTLGQNGNDISVHGLSDVYINGHYKVSDKLRLSLGAKLPLTKGNRASNGLPLPMDYQSSLGTVDLIAGVGYTIKKLQLVAAVQQPLAQNKNTFNPAEYPANSPLRTFQSTVGYERSGDAIFRATYPIRLNDKWQISPSALTIYHLQPDTYLAGNTRQEITGSDGLTFNANVYFEYKPKPISSIQLILGAPFVVREARPDGLTRSFVGGLEYRMEF